MTTELYSRISHIKQYINQLHQHISANDNHNAASTINKFKKTVMKEDPQQHANQFLLDCLRAKHQKLNQELQDIQGEKVRAEERIIVRGKGPNTMKEVSASIFISRLTVSLNQIKKVEYDDVSITCDYRTVNVHSLIGTKYKNYKLAVESIIAVESKLNYAYLQYQDTMKLNILIKFLNQKQMNRWVTCINFGVMIQTSRKKQKLFQVKKDEPERSVANSNTSSPQYQSISPLQAPIISFKQTSPSQSVSIIEERRERSLLDKMQKNTERSLVNAMGSADRSRRVGYDRDDKSVRDESFANHKEVSQTGQRQTNNKLNVNPKYKDSRPPYLTRIRGFSENIDNFKDSRDTKSHLDISKSYKKDNIRKNSDNLGTQINQVYHEQMLAKLKENTDEDGSGSTFSKRRLQSYDFAQQNSNEGVSNQHETGKATEEKPNRQKTVKQKTEQLLLNTKGSKMEMSALNFEGKINWGIQEIQDQNNSRASAFDTRSMRESVSIRNSNNSSNSKTRDIVDRSEHITQKSDEESPVWQKKRLDDKFPTKISYENGPMFRLLAVEKNDNNETNNARQSVQIQKIESQQEQESSQSESHDFSNSSSLKNHTETEDNAARAQELKKGLSLTKCSQNGWWTHEKIVYLSETQNQVCMRDIGDKKIKKIKLYSISSVEYKKFDQGIFKHITKIQEDKCLVIRAEIEDKKLKNFEFYGNNAEALQRFASNLSQFIEYNRKDK